MTRFYVNGKVVDTVDLLKKRRWLWRLDSWPFAILYATWMIVILPSLDFLDAFIVLGGLLAVHILVFLFTVWSVDFKCFVQYSKVKDIHHANACKITPAKFCGSKEVIPLHFRKNSSAAEPSSDPSPDKETNNGNVDLWKPFSYLLEVTNRSKNSKFTSQGSTVNSETPVTPKSEGHVRKTKGKDQLKRSKFQDENGRSDVDVTESAKPKIIRKYRKNKAGSKAVLDADANANNAVADKRVNPIWFHLVPSKEQEGEPLGQIEGSFVKLKFMFLAEFKCIMCLTSTYLCFVQLAGSSIGEIYFDFRKQCFIYSDEKKNFL